MVLPFGRFAFCRSTKSAVRKPTTRLFVESLEDRCLLSAGYTVVPLASDVPALAPATDPSLVNPWGISYSPTGPFWFSDNGTGASDLLDGSGNGFDLAVSIPPAQGPSAGTPTGTVFNPGPGFLVSNNGVSGSSQFLFATEDGTISGWAPDVNLTHAILAVNNSAQGANYKGLALATDNSGNSFLYAADFGTGTVDMFNDNFQPVIQPGAFQDLSLPSQYAPFNIEEIGNQLYVSYAQQDALHHDQVNGAGNGFIDVFSLHGDLIRRFASGGTLDSPWGMTQAPAGFGQFGGDLLVGNAGDGHISAFDPNTGAYQGQLAGNAGQPLALGTLWSLKFGNGYMGGDANTLFFATGFDDESHGLFGAIQSPNNKGSHTAGLGGFDPNVPGERSDYPIPPRIGPDLGAVGGVSAPVSVLLPLNDSSLALAPTLFAVPQFNSAAATVTGPYSAASSTRASRFQLVASTATVIPEEHASQAGDEQNNPMALNSFLDVDPSRNAAVNAEPAIALDIQPMADPVASSVTGPSVEYNFAAVTQASPPVTPTLPTTTEASQAAVATQSGNPEPARHQETTAPQDRGAWATLLVGFLSVVSLPLAWGRSVKWRFKPAAMAEEELGDDLPTTKVV